MQFIARKQQVNMLFYVSILSSLDIKLKFLTNWIELTRLLLESRWIELKICLTWLESSWKYEQLDSRLIQVQNVNLILNLMISLLQCYLNENLSKDFIQVSHFQMIIFVFFIKKFEEELCFCMNYQDLNIITVKNQYSLSLISETLNHLSWIKIFIKLNIISAFNQLWIKEKDEAFIIFCTQFELFKYLVMLFNLCNEFISFQKYINNILYKHLNKFYTVYLNDILIYFDNEFKHEIYVKLILQKL